MIRSLVSRFAKRKNPDFTLDPAVSSRALISLATTRLWWRLRSYQLLAYGAIPKSLYIGKHVSFFNTRNIDFGRFVQIHDGAYLSALGKGPLKLGNNVNIGAYSRVVISQTFNDLGSHIAIGDNVGLGDFAHLGGAGGLDIGSDCIIGAYFSCHPENHRFDDPDKLIRHQGVSRKGIKIGSNCWIGAKVTILDGVTIGDNCVIAAGAVVNKSIPSNSVVAGVPAKVIKQIDGNLAHKDKAMLQKLGIATSMN
ncbi:MAG: DapH/DapD/GlmU-related protein [Bacteroidia bacterium]